MDDPEGNEKEKILITSGGGVELRGGGWMRAGFGGVPASLDTTSR